MNKDQVLILMSTYNGRKYLSEQIKSIFDQETDDIEISLLIRDDGSEDNTLEIVKDFQKKYKNIKLIVGDNIGPAQSFRSLINECNLQYTYYAFSDQDDIWCKNKIATAVQEMQLEQNKSPILWYSALSRLNSERKENYFFCPVEKANDFESVIDTFATTNGCTMVFNRRLLEILKEVPAGKIDMHDSWTNAMCLAVGGKVIADSRVFVKYRIHDDQVLGNKRKTLKMLFCNFRNPSLKRRETVNTMLKSKYIMGKQREYLEIINNYKNNKRKILLKKRPLGITHREYFKFLIQILCNTY